MRNDDRLVGARAAGQQRGRRRRRRPRAPHLPRSAHSQRQARGLALAHPRAHFVEHLAVIVAQLTVCSPADTMSPGVGVKKPEYCPSIHTAAGAVGVDEEGAARLRSADQLERRRSSRVVGLDRALTVS